MQAVHFILFVQNQNLSRDFFSSMLQSEPRLDTPGMTEFSLVDGAILGLMPISSVEKLGLPKGKGGSELYFIVSDPEETIKRAQHAGACLVSPLSMRNWGARVAYLVDLDGHIIAVADRSV